MEKLEEHVLDAFLAHAGAVKLTRVAEDDVGARLEAAAAEAERRYTAALTNVELRAQLGDADHDAMLVALRREARDEAEETAVPRQARRESPAALASADLGALVGELRRRGDVASLQRIARCRHSGRLRSASGIEVAQPPDQRPRPGRVARRGADQDATPGASGSSRAPTRGSAEIRAEERARGGRMSSRAKERAGWVREAVAITDVIIKDADGRYLCPLCIEWFDDLADLTLEHAPPEASTAVPSRSPVATATAAAATPSTTNCGASRRCSSSRSGA